MRMRTSAITGHRLTLLPAFATLLLCTGVARCQTPTADGAEEPGVFQVIATYQTFNPLIPWQKTPPATRYGYGIDVGSGCVLTTEHLVRNHTLIELRRPRSGEKIPVQVEISDPQVNLALLRLGETRHGSSAYHPKLAERVSRNQAVAILQFDETRQIQRGQGQVLQIGMTKLPRAMYASLSFKLLTDINVQGEGAPVMADDRLAGLMISHEASTRTGHMVPYSVIAQFLDDARQAPYRGFAAAGFAWTPLVDPGKRAYFNVRRPQKGVLVLSCVPGTGAAESLRPNDVILEWDGHEIGNLGFYNDNEFGRLTLSHLIKGRRVPGDIVPVTLIREGAEIEVEVTLTRLQDRVALIPENVVGARPEYLVQGGLVIRQLTGLYLRSHGPKWQQAVDARLMQLYNTRRSAPSQPGEHIVILSRVLPHPINVGYQRFADRIITRVNGRAVKNMDDVFRIVDRDGTLEGVSLRSVGVDIVLATNRLASADAQLASNYAVPDLRYRRPPGSDEADRLQGN